VITTRREFLGSSLRAGLALPAAVRLPQVSRPDDEPISASPLASQFPDLPRRFVFEYYPWYALDPVRHWDQWDRIPPVDIASPYVPRLGAYDSRSPAVVEQHARWIVESGAGAVNLSWWGRDSFQDRATPLVMDVMRDHGLKVAFHLEPYAQDHGRRFADDVLYLLREFGEKRSWDALLLLGASGGAVAPVFKGFRMILPAVTTDCHGITRPVNDYTADTDWVRQLDSLRDQLRSEFPTALFLADTVNVTRARDAGFDGIAVYDHYIRPEAYALHAIEASALGLLFSFNVNPGFDSISPRSIEPDSCYSPLPFEPVAEPPIAWERAEERERAAALSTGRIGDSLDATIAAQTDASLSNARRGFFLVYLNSFNEWHEGHAFEPMLDAAALTAEQRALGYHNPAHGDYRLATLRARLAAVLAGRS
jgi:hypothetical protein